MQTRRWKQNLQCLQVLGSRAEFEVHLVYLPTKAGERFSI